MPEAEEIKLEFDFEHADISPGMEVVSLIFADEGVTESLLVTPLAQNLFRLEESPLNDELAFYDVIEGERQGDGNVIFQRVAKKSEMRRFSYLLNNQIIDSMQFQSLQQQVMEIGGNWERLFGGIVIFSLPSEGTLDVENEVNAIIQSIASADSAT